MEAKDTIMTTKQIEKLAQKATNQRLVDVVAKTQAEISFKKGREDGVNFRKACDVWALNEMKKAGMQKVVEWINGQYTYTSNELKIRLQAQLKEWGINGVCPPLKAGWRKVELEEIQKIKAGKPPEKSATESPTRQKSSWELGIDE